MPVSKPYPIIDARRRACFLVPMLTAALALVIAADTPEGALRDFVAAINKADITAAVKLVDGADPKYDRELITSMLRESKVKLTLGPITRKDTVLTFDVTVSDFPFVGGDEKVAGSTVNVVQREEGWKILASKDPKNHKGIVGEFAAMLKSDAIFKAAKNAAKRSATLSNLKQIALATIMYSTDNKDILKMTSKDAETKLAPYLKNLDISRTPLWNGTTCTSSTASSPASRSTRSKLPPRPSSGRWAPRAPSSSLSTTVSRQSSPTPTATSNRLAEKLPPSSAGNPEEGLR
ncbi:hypothetical protein EON79_04480 [bacterium]|nr:MAG: hypothetical protein EON79_04480 [bacterium]